MAADELWQRVDVNVEWIERRAQELAIAETDRTRALDTKASQVLAVAAVATSIAASALGPRLATAPEVAVWFAVLAGLFVLTATATSVWALFPRAFLSFESDEIAQWPTGDFLTQRQRDIQGRFLNGWLEVVGRARRVNGRKATLVRTGLIALGLALACTAATAGTIASDAESGPKAEFAGPAA